MAAATRTGDSKLYVRISEGSKDQLINKDFNYPLLLTYQVFTTDRSTNKDILIYERNISIQKGGLETGLQLHPRSITPGRKRPFLIVFDSFHMRSITAGFCRTVYGY
jgi:hypothetical protein